ncbi:uncharacterized protein IWZ02DRAFT_429069 [Phyllosticta citriasiana]|uniref:uncharacterized protein n=1 Tax=Phyllosticta citriasiana TaxID=595635 RepID=UPI0030FDF041
MVSIVVWTLLEGALIARPPSSPSDKNPGFAVVTGRGAAPSEQLVCPKTVPVHHFTHNEFAHSPLFEPNLPTRRILLLRAAPSSLLFPSVRPSVRLGPDMAMATPAPRAVPVFAVPQSAISRCSPIAASMIQHVWRRRASRRSGEKEETPRDEHMDEFLSRLLVIGLSFFPFSLAIVVISPHVARRRTGVLSAPKANASLHTASRPCPARSPSFDKAPPSPKTPS